MQDIGDSVQQSRKTSFIAAIVEELALRSPSVSSTVRLNSDDVKAASTQFTVVE